MRNRKIPDETVSRLPHYLRALMHFVENGQRRVSSAKLAEELRLNPWIIRKDFSYFGDFGTRGVGYDTQVLIDHISRILRLEQGRRAALVGVGNLGLAILSHKGFDRYGFEIIAAYDCDPKKIGKTVNGVKIEDVANLREMAGKGIDVAILTLPDSSAQQIADQMVLAGVRGILNFSPSSLALPKKVKVINIDIAMDLARLAFYMPARRQHSTSE